MVGWVIAHVWIMSNLADRRDAKPVKARELDGNRTVNDTT